VIAVTPVVYKAAFAGKRSDGSSYDIKPHYEMTVTVLAGPYVVQAVVKYVDEVPGHESVHTPLYAVNEDIDVPLIAVGKRSNGVWQVYI